MAGTIYGLTNYYSAFISPLKSYEVNPSTNLMYGTMANKIYSQTFAKKLQSSVSTYLTSLNRDMNDLKISAKNLASTGPDSSFNKKAVAVSDTTSLTGTAASNADLRTYTLNVSRLASSQINEGTKVGSNNKTSFNAGINTFEIKSGDTSKYVSFSVNENETNKTSLESMARAINNSNSGISAMVVSDSTAGTSFLKLSSKNTGTGSSFSLTDISGSAVSVSNSNSAATTAQDAEYNVNGTKFTSQDNTISLNNGKVELTLKKAESKDIQLTVAPDKESIKSDIMKVAESYNNAVNFSNSFSTDFEGAHILSDELGDIVKSGKIPLAHMGISINSDNTLSLDENKLNKALSDNLQEVSQIFQGKNGIAQRFYVESAKVLNSPMEYSKPAGLSSFSSFYNYMQSANKLNYKQNPYLGMVVDTLL